MRVSKLSYEVDMLQKDILRRRILAAIPLNNEPDPSTLIRPRLAQPPVTNAPTENTDFTRIIRARTVGNTTPVIDVSSIPTTDRINQDNSIASMTGGAGLSRRGWGIPSSTPPFADSFGRATYPNEPTNPVTMVNQAPTINPRVQANGDVP